MRQTYLLLGESLQGLLVALLLEFRLADQFIQATRLILEDTIETWVARPLRVRQRDERSSDP